MGGRTMIDVGSFWRQDWKTADTAERRYTASTGWYSCTVTVRDNPASGVNWEVHIEPSRPSIPGVTSSANGKAPDDHSALDFARTYLTRLEKLG